MSGEQEKAGYGCRTVRSARNLGPMHDFGRLIEQVTRLLRRAFDEKARAIGVTRVQFQTLMALSNDESLGQAHLAEMFDVEPITVSRLINRLQANGLVVRRDHPTDRRAHNLVLTAKARRILTQLMPLTSNCLREALAGLSPEELHHLTGALEVVRGNLQGARGRLG